MNKFISRAFAIWNRQQKSSSKYRGTSRHSRKRPNSKVAIAQKIYRQLKK